MRRAEPFVIYEVADRIATVRLNRPEVRNALSIGRSSRHCGMQLCGQDPTVMWTL